MQTKEVQGKLWSTSPADWVKYLEPTWTPMYQAVLKQLQLDENKMLLDAGCGAGLFLTMAASTGVIIHGIDAAPGLLAVSRKRLPGATLLLEDLEELPFMDETFDVVTGFNSFQYAGSFENALREAQRVLKKDGKLVIGIWSKKDDCESSALLEAVVNLLPPPPPGTPGPFALSEDGRMEAICETVGLKIVHKESVLCPWKFNGEEDLQRGFLCTAPCAKAVQLTSRDEVMDAIYDSAQQFKQANDVYYMKNYFTFFITEKG